MLEHCCHAPAVAGPAWIASIGTRAESTPIFLLHLPGAAGPGEEPRYNSLTSPFLSAKSEFIHRRKRWVCGLGVMAHGHRAVWLDLAPGPTAVLLQFCVPGLSGPCLTSWAQLGYE